MCASFCNRYLVPICNIKKGIKGNYLQVQEVYETVILAEFEDVREQLEPNEDTVQSYLDYVERTWIGRRLGRATKKPMFPITSWNHYKSLLTGNFWGNHSYFLVLPTPSNTPPPNPPTQCTHTIKH